MVRRGVAAARSFEGQRDLRINSKTCFVFRMVRRGVAAAIVIGVSVNGVSPTGKVSHVTVQDYYTVHSLMFT